MLQRIPGKLGFGVARQPASAGGAARAPGSTGKLGSRQAAAPTRKQNVSFSAGAAAPTRKQHVGFGAAGTPGQRKQHFSVGAFGKQLMATISAAAATALLAVVVGDSGSGGTKGLAPAPAAGDAAAGKYLDAAGGYSVPAGGGAAAVATNLFPNGGFEVWQRSTSVAVAASAVQYTCDRVFLVTGANQASVVSRVAGLGNNSQYAAKVLRNNGQTGTGVMRFCIPLDTDEIYQVRGKKCTVAFDVKAGANWSPASGTLSWQLVSSANAGPAKRGASAYTSEQTDISTSTNITGSITRANATSAAVVGATMTQMELQFFWTPVGTAGADDSFTIDNLKIEAATSATAFEDLPFQRALLSCMGFYQKTFAYATTPADNTVDYAGCIQHMYHPSSGTYEPLGVWRFMVPMRAIPSATLYNPDGATAAQWRDGTTTSANARAITISQNGMMIDNAGVVLTNNAGNYRIHSAVDASI